MAVTLKSRSLWVPSRPNKPDSPFQPLHNQTPAHLARGFVVGIGSCHVLRSLPRVIQISAPSTSHEISRNLMKDLVLLKQYQRKNFKKLALYLSEFVNHFIKLNPISVYVPYNREGWQSLQGIAILHRFVLMILLFTDGSRWRRYPFPGRWSRYS